MGFMYDKTNREAFDPVRGLKVGFSPRYDDGDSPLLRFADQGRGVTFDFSVDAPEIVVKSGVGSDVKEVRVARTGILSKEGLAIVMRPAVRGRSYFDELGLTSDEFFELLRGAAFQLLSRGGEVRRFVPDFDVKWAAN